MTLKQRFAMFPWLMEMSDNKLVNLGINPTEAAVIKEEIAAEAAEALKAEQALGFAHERRNATDAYGSLNWNVVCKEAVQGFSTQALAPLINVFSTDISGDTIPASDPDAMPKVTVPVIGLATENAVVENPTDLDEIGTGFVKGVAVDMTVLASAVDFSVSAMWEGHKVVNMIKGAIEVLRRKAVEHVYSKLVATSVTDTDGTAIAAPSTVTVPALDEGWDAGYANRHLTAALDADDVSLVVNRQYYSGLLQADNDDLGFNQLAFEGVYKSGQTSALGTNAVGFVAAKNAMAVGMRAPHLLSGAYDSIMQMRDGDTLLPLTMVQYYDPAKMKLRVVLLTAVGAKRCCPDAAAILTTAAEEGTAEGGTAEGGTAEGGTAEGGTAEE